MTSRVTPEIPSFGDEAIRYFSDNVAMAELLEKMSSQQLDDFIDRLLEAGLLPIEPCPASRFGAHLTGI
ncbi:hypothetical protein PhaeoP24_00726 [Phaeobacter inhibens]|nr:hypothetical protein PhaeoP24_00726 [Phaeobacter inhibens]